MFLSFPENVNAYLISIECIWVYNFERIYIVIAFPEYFGRYIISRKFIRLRLFESNCIIIYIIIWLFMLILENLYNYVVSRGFI